MIFFNVLKLMIGVDGVDQSSTSLVPPFGHEIQFSSRRIIKAIILIQLQNPEIFLEMYRKNT